MTPGDSLAGEITRGVVRAVARGLSMVENGSSDASELLHALFPVVPDHRTIGVTGPPGAGKSTLLDRMITRYRSLGSRVGVIAVDPSSPFTGGALLGDRLRMQSHSTDPGVFIRSMGSRGHLGGLSGATRDAALLLAAAGYDPVFLETVGVGQAEVEIAEVADLTVLVLVPGAGDDVQAMKAGIMEIGDLIVLNKADRPGIEQLEAAVAASLDLAPCGRPKPRLARVSAVTGEGLEELWALMDCHLASIDPAKRRLENTRRTLRGILTETGTLYATRLLDRECGTETQILELISKGATTPYEVGRKLARASERMLSGDERKQD
jgi:LAO/AO transport system kinase